MMQSSDPNTTVEHTLRRLGYPSRLDQTHLWTIPRAAIGIPTWESDCVEVVYWEGLPRAVVSWGTEPEAVLEYAAGSAFCQPPPVALVFGESGTLEAFKWEESGFQTIPGAPSWNQTLAKPPGHVSLTQANAVIQAVAEGNRNWLEDSRSRKVIGALPRIFPEETVVLYELLQNAADSGATEAEFRLDSENLLFLHDGFPFTENDVESISFVNSSTKPLDNIGFMGLGFKAAFEITDSPEVHSPPFCFRFDGREEGGQLLPIPTDCTHSALGRYTTSFEFPLDEGAKALIADELEQFDGRLLLYIGANLRRIATPSSDFRLGHVEERGETRILEVSDVRNISRREYAVFSRELEPSVAAWNEFAKDRNLELSQCEGRKQRVSIAVPLDNGVPDTTHSGRLQVYLPTYVRLPLSFDFQGNFLVGASRKELRHAAGPWNKQHFHSLPVIVADALEWAKSLATDAPSWASWYDLIPDWEDLAEHVGLNDTFEEGITSDVSLHAAFADELSKRKLLPSNDRQGSLVFVSPENATAVDHDLQTVLSAGEIARLSGSNVIMPELSDAAEERLAGYVRYFGADNFKTSIEDSTWVGHIDAFSDGIDSRRGRQQLAKVLAYLERNWSKYPGHLGKCVVILTQEGRLRAAYEQKARRVRTLPDVDISFPTEELADHYDVSHQGFRRQLNRPAEMDLGPNITQDAIKALQRVAPTLEPRLIATEVILPLFQGDRWEGVIDERLYRYTRFLMQHSRVTIDATKSSSFKVKVRGLSRKYLPPDQIYLGRGYTLEGERLDQLCANAEGVHFLSDDYLFQAGVTKDEWVKFFSSLGARARPRIHRSTRQIPESNLAELEELTEETRRTEISLRASSIDGIWAKHYALDDFFLESPIQKIVRKLYREKPPGWRDRIVHFSALLESGWAEYENKLTKELRYARRFSSSIRQIPVAAPSSFAKFLKDEPWLPVVDIDSTSRLAHDVVLYTEENRRLADKETPLSYSTFSDSSLISFLDIRERPPKVTPVMRIQYAVERGEDDPSVFADLYNELARTPDLEIRALRSAFQDHCLIFVPDHDPKYISPRDAVFSSRTILAPMLVAIEDAYPDLEEFFAESLGVPTSESFEHFVGFLRDYAWEVRPAISDNLRSSVESCYRRFFSYLNQTEDEEREEALESLKKQLGSPAMVFCGALGWVDTTETTVLYPDTAAYEGLLSDRPGIAIESHLKRLALPLNEIRPLLDALNVKPISEVIQRVPEIGNPELHLQSNEFSERLTLLVQIAVEIVEREQATTESVSRNVNLFLQEWRERSESLFGDVRFYRSPSIEVRDVLLTDTTTLREMNLGAYVLAGKDSLRVYVSGDIIEVFDAISDQLANILRLDLLPAGLRDEISSLVQSNLARLEHEQFENHLFQRLREKGLPVAVKDGEEVQNIIQSATKELEAEAGSEGQVGESGYSTESPSNSKSNSGGGYAGSTQWRNQSKVPTSEEILAQLPDFDEASYEVGNVVDLSGTSQWHTQTQKPGLRVKGGGGPGGGGSFRNAQAYRDAYGKRGEEWVAEQERRRLKDVGRPDLAKRVNHRSQGYEGSSWDIESFEKSHPYKAIRVEVKSTPDTDNFEVEMSVDQVRTALQSSRPYYLYRVVDVSSSNPTVYIYDFKKIASLLKFSATNVSVALPRPEEPEL